MKIEIKISEDNKRAVELAIEFIEECANHSGSRSSEYRQQFVKDAINLLPHALEVKKFGQLDRTRSYIPHICDTYIDKVASYRERRKINFSKYFKQSKEILVSVRKLYDYEDFEQLEFK